MYLYEIREALENFKYRDWVIWAEMSIYHDVDIIGLSGPTEDALGTPGPFFLNGSFPIISRMFSTEKHVIDFARKCVHKATEHEIDEFIKVRGERIFNPHLAPDNGMKYIIADHLDNKQQKEWAKILNWPYYWKDCQ